MTVASASDDEHFECEDCGWRWPLTGTPSPTSECDNCGGDLVLVEEDEVVRTAYEEATWD